MVDFRPFSPLHFAALATIALLLAASVAARRRYAGAGPTAAEHAVAYTYLLAWVGTFVWLNAGPRHDPHTTWPLQMCHWVAALDAIVLVRPAPALRAIAYFCGLALCTQALFTPSLVEGPDQWPFWFFWATHGMIVAVPIYDIAARGYRPDARAFAIACAAALGYVALMLPINLATGWNYGFVGNASPEVPSIVDLLGPWPQRLVAIVAIAFAAMGLLLVPWLLRRAGRA